MSWSGVYKMTFRAGTEKVKCTWVIEVKVMEKMLPKKNKEDVAYTSFMLSCHCALR